MPLTITINEAAPGTLTIGVGTPGVGVPNGGSTGTVLKKLSGADYDTGWASDISGVAWGDISGTLSTQTDLQTALNLKLASSTAASTYQTLAGMSSYLTTATAASTYFTIANAANKANLASPSLTGTPLSTTAAVNTNTTQIATTAFVVAQAGAATPLVNGTAAVGTSLRYARADHVHPTDTSRAALASPSLTGTPLSTTAAADTNTTQIATTAFVVGQASSTTPAATGTAAIGTSLKYARADHVHVNPLPSGGTTGQVLSKVDGTSYNVAWTTPSGGGYITSVSSPLSVTSGDLSVDLTAYLALAGGTMTGSITSFGATHDTEMSGELFGVQLSADHTKGTTLEFDGLDTYDGASHMQVNPTGLVFPDATTQTTAGLPLTGGTMTGAINSDFGNGYTSTLSDGGFSVVGGGENSYLDNTTVGFSSAAGGSSLDASQLHVSDNNTGNEIFVTANGLSSVISITFQDSTVQTTAYTGGGTAWGSISGNLSDQTDLLSALNDKYPTSNPSGFTNYGSSQNFNDISGGTTSSLANSASNGQVLSYDSSSYALRWVSASTPGYTNSVWAYGNWYSANVTGIYDGYMNYYTVLTF